MAGLNLILVRRDLDSGHQVKFNEIIDLFASFTRKRIIQQINNTIAFGTYTGIICDENSDIR